MVQLKYFGDDRDYFKYDLIAKLLSALHFENYVFVPMLTHHRDDNEGRLVPKNRGDKSEVLFDFIMSCKTKTLNHWKGWLKDHSYHTVMPVDTAYFSHSDRNSYWESFLPLVSKQSALVFIDPDTGLESRSEAYRKKMGPEKYLLNQELLSLFQSLHDSSCIMIYQHLPRNRHFYTAQTEKKMSQALSACGRAYVSAYREGDLAFLFLTKTDTLAQKLLTFLKEYQDTCLIDDKMLFPIKTS